MVKEIEAKSILIRSKHPSSWFGVHYYLNIYRGCTHGCIYCDSRSECYGIENFDTDISVKINSIELLEKELKKKRYRNTIGFGSTSDPYVPIEIKYKLTRSALEIVKKYRHPLFILTKSDLVVRDLDLICDINNQNYACVAFTITTASEELSKFIEPNAPLPAKRFETMSILSSMGIKTGINLMPLLPFINDDLAGLKKIVDCAIDSGASFIVPSFGVTLRDRQRDYFYNKIGSELAQKYVTKYHNNCFCSVPNYTKLLAYFENYCKEKGISTKMPSYESENAQIQFTFPN